MKYVLLKLDDVQAQKFVKKVGSKALGVWDVPNHCSCPAFVQKQAGSWEFNSITGRHECIDCGGTHKPVTSLGERLKIAFLGRNLVKKFR